MHAMDKDNRLHQQRGYCLQYQLLRLLRKTTSAILYAVNFFVMSSFAIIPDMETCAVRGAYRKCTYSSDFSRYPRPSPTHVLSVGVTSL